MSANPPDDARERLNYFNGQRLAAADFRAEQGHHTGMRRVLNHALYSSGIVTGLEVELVSSDKPADRHLVKVRRGLAFDHLGREIFLPEDVLVHAMGAPSTTEGVVFGNLLVDLVPRAAQEPGVGRLRGGERGRILQRRSRVGRADAHRRRRRVRGPRLVARDTKAAR